MLSVIMQKEMPLSHNWAPDNNTGEVTELEPTQQTSNQLVDEVSIAVINDKDTTGKEDPTESTVDTTRTQAIQPPNPS